MRCDFSNVCITWHARCDENVWLMEPLSRMDFKICYGCALLGGQMLLKWVQQKLKHFHDTFPGGQQPLVRVFFFKFLTKLQTLASLRTIDKLEFFSRSSKMPNRAFGKFKIGFLISQLATLSRRLKYQSKFRALQYQFKNHFTNQKSAIRNSQLNVHVRRNFSEFLNFRLKKIFTSRDSFSPKEHK